MSSIDPLTSTFSRIFSNHQRSRTDPVTATPDKPWEDTLVTRCSHNVVIDLVYGSIDRNLGFTTSTPLAPHVTRFPHLEDGVTYATEPEYCYACDLKKTHAAHLRLCDDHVTQMEKLERECKGRIIELNIDQFNLTDPREQVKLPQRQKIIRESLNQILQKQKEQQDEICRHWKEFHFNWQGAQYGAFLTPGEIPIAIMPRIPDPATRKWEDSAPDQVIEDDTAKPQKVYEMHFLEITFHLAFEGGLQEVELRWAQRDRKGHNTVPFRQCLNLLPKYRLYDLNAADDQRLHPAEPWWFKGYQTSTATYE